MRVTPLSVIQKRRVRIMANNRPHRPRNADPQIIHDLIGAAGPLTLSLFDSSPDCIQLIELDGNLSYMNPNGQTAMGITDFQHVEGRPWSSLWTNESLVKMSLAVASARASRPNRLTILRPGDDGAEVWWDVSVSPVLDRDERVVRILSISRDVTASIAREDKLRDYEQKLTTLNKSLSDELRLRDVLMREIDHRVKNSLAMIAAILRLQSRDASNEEAAQKLASAAARVNTVARVHERLQSAVDVSVVDMKKYLPTLAADVTDALSQQNITLSIKIDPISIDSDRAVPLGMIAAELVTNAFKHAFDEAGGDVTLRLEHTSPETLRMSIRDDGRGGCVMADHTQNRQMKIGLGTKIVQLHAKQLNAKIDCVSPVGIGTTISLDMPA